MISKATKYNWEKLNIKDKPLDSRANKRLSVRRVIPFEYFDYKKNMKCVTDIVENIVEHQYNVFDAMFSLCLNLLKKNNINKIITDKTPDVIDTLTAIQLPEDEHDILGIIYQLLNTEGEKNKRGSYYTPKNIVETMTKNIFVAQNQKLLDPCCGTGAFLCNTETANPENLFGYDIDEIAVMIAKTNVLIKYKDNDFVPNIFCIDYLDNSFTGKFDYIITNPPWGAMEKKYYFELMPEIKSGETFSYFLLKSTKEITENGKIVFLLPASFLNIKIHGDIRKYLIENSNIEHIQCFNSSFNKVSTDYLCITLTKTPQNNFTIFKNDSLYVTNKNEIVNREDYTIPLLTDDDKRILHKVFSQKYSTLGKSKWALGIVTGSNKTILQKTPKIDLEAIYTGKEILPYTFKNPQYYIKFEPEKFQQTAPEAYYRAKEKLVYKFISNKLVFAYDNSQSLVLNSANILIPFIDSMSIKTVLVFLNSSLYKYIYNKMFGDVKILKSNLMKLPFPTISKENDDILKQIADEIINGHSECIKAADKIVFDIFSINSIDRLYISNLKLK